MECWPSGLRHLTANETKVKLPQVRILHTPPKDGLVAIAIKYPCRDTRGE